MERNGACTIRTRFGQPSGCPRASKDRVLRERRVDPRASQRGLVESQGDRMEEKSPKHRQRRGSAWYWQQTDCWYYTPPGTKKRVALFDEHGQRIRGKQS